MAAVRHCGWRKNKLKKYGLSKEPALLTKLRAEIKAASARVLELYPCYTKAAVESKGDDYFNIPRSRNAAAGETSGAPSAV
eukprot:COSAG03_NODE_6535_length_1045_cov_1.110994_1_plen_80_part_10